MKTHQVHYTTKNTRSLVICLFSAFKQSGSIRLTRGFRNWSRATFEVYPFVHPRGMRHVYEENPTDAYCFTIFSLCGRVQNILYHNIYAYSFSLFSVKCVNLTSHYNGSVIRRLYLNENSERDSRLSRFFYGCNMIFVSDLGNVCPTWIQG